MSAAFGQSIADVVGRSRKSQAQKILKDFDDSAAKAHTFATKACKYITMANELMEKSHHECFTAMSNLLAGARADRDAANARRRGKKKKTSSASVFFPFSCFFFAVSNVSIVQLLIYICCNLLSHRTQFFPSAATSTGDQDQCQPSGNEENAFQGENLGGHSLPPGSFCYEYLPSFFSCCIFMSFFVLLNCVAIGQMATTRFFLVPYPIFFHIFS